VSARVGIASTQRVELVADPHLQELVEPPALSSARTVSASGPCPHACTTARARVRQNGAAAVMKGSTSRPGPSGSRVRWCPTPRVPRPHRQPVAVARSLECALGPFRANEAGDLRVHQRLQVHPDAVPQDIRSLPLEPPANRRRQAHSGLGLRRHLLSACPWRGRGGCRTRRRPNGPIGSSLAMATGSIGLTSMRISAPRECSAAFPHIARRIVPIRLRLAGRGSRRAARSKS